MRSNYSNNKLNHSNEFDTSRKEKLNFSQNGVQVASIETSMETKQVKGRRMGTLAMHCGIPFSIITEDSKGKKVPMLSMPINKMFININNINVVSSLKDFIIDNTDDFLVLRIKDNKSLTEIISSYFDIGDTVSKRAISEMKKAKFIKKHNNKTWSFNPFAVFRVTLSIYKLYELQAHWELSSEPKSCWTIIDEEVVWKATKESLDRAVDIVKEKLNEVNIKEKDLNNINNNKELVLKTLSVFWKYTKKNSNEETLTKYIKSEKGMRHLRNWWLSDNSKSLNPFYVKTDIELEFDYRRRNEYRKLFLQIIKDYKTKISKDS